MEPFTRNDWLFRLKSTQKAFPLAQLCCIFTKQSIISDSSSRSARDGTVLQIWPRTRIQRYTAQQSRPPPTLFFPPRCMNSIIYTFTWCQSSHLLPEKKRKAIFMLNQNVDKLPKVDIGLCLRLDVTLWARWPAEQLWKRAAHDNFGVMQMFCDGRDATVVWVCVCVCSNDTVSVFASPLDVWNTNGGPLALHPWTSLKAKRSQNIRHGAPYAGAQTVWQLTSVKPRENRRRCYNDNFV